MPVRQRRTAQSGDPAAYLGLRGVFRQLAGRDCAWRGGGRNLGEAAGATRSGDTQHFDQSGIILVRCDPNDLVACARWKLKYAKLAMPYEDTMTLKLLAAKNLAAIHRAALLVAVAALAVGVSATHADAAKRKNTDRAYAQRGPNVSYQAGPRTRIYVTKRSWLDAGTEVLPGERKFLDYAIPPGPSFGNQNMNRPLDRQPLSPPSDLGGYPERIPLY